MEADGVMRTAGRPGFQAVTLFRSAPAESSAGPSGSHFQSCACLILIFSLTTREHVRIARQSHLDGGRTNKSCTISVCDKACGVCVVL